MDDVRSLARKVSELRGDQSGQGLRVVQGGGKFRPVAPPLGKCTASVLGTGVTFP